MKSLSKSAPHGALLGLLLPGFTLFAMSIASAAPSVYPTGVTIYDPAKTYDTDVIFGGADRKTHLIDIAGNEIRRWDYVGFPSELLDPALTKGQKGHVLVQLEALPDKDPQTGTSLNPGQKLQHGNKTIGELDWDGKLVWSWGAQAPQDGAARQHHDWQRLASGNTLILANQVRSLPGFRVKQSYDDVIYEIAPKGKIVWQWAASDHLAEFGFSPASLQLLKDTAKPDYLHVNNLTTLGPNKWFAAGDARFAPDNLLIDSREANFIAIIERKTGKVVWHLGPDFAASTPTSAAEAGVRNRLPRPVDQISGQHDAHLIPEGLPGAGNLLVFDNQGEAGYPPVPLNVLPGSRVLEIDPVKREIVWEYTAEKSGRPSWTFYSAFISSARRLPNGNTLIDEGKFGRFFQVTAAGEIVWEYVSPYFGNTEEISSRGPVLSNWVYRAQPVPRDWIPVSTTHASTAVTPPDLSSYRVSR